jgi:hypothetical protein
MRFAEAVRHAEMVMRSLEDSQTHIRQVHCEREPTPSSGR